MHLLDVKSLRIQRGTIMLLPNDIKPELSVYYYASLILKIITEKKRMKYLLFTKLLSKNLIFR